jgi:RNA polymerase sigma-70 factor (ECF subfamily)
MSMSELKARRNFGEDVLPHLDAAYNLARWLTRNEQDAQDVVQEAYIRAFRFFGGFRGGNARAWLLRIVRNTCYTWLQQNRQPQPMVEFDEKLFGPDPCTPNPEEALLRNDSRNLLRKALETLPQRFREVLILRELEGMSYKEISEVTGIPPGTVMSRLSRARGGLRQSLASLAQEPMLRNSGRVVWDPRSPAKADSGLESAHNQFFTENGEQEPRR